MANKKSCHLSFGNRLTAYETADHLNALNTFISELERDAPATIDASATANVDTAGCQLIDLALTAARKKEAALEVKLSEAVQQAFSILGLGETGEAHEAD